MPQRTPFKSKHFDLPEGWSVDHVAIPPGHATVRTTAIRPYRVCVHENEFMYTQGIAGYYSNELQVINSIKQAEELSNLRNENSLLPAGSFAQIVEALGIAPAFGEELTIENVKMQINDLNKVAGDYHEIIDKLGLDEACDAYVEKKIVLEQIDGLQCHLIESDLRIAELEDEVQGLDLENGEFSKTLKKENEEQYSLLCDLCVILDMDFHFKVLPHNLRTLKTEYNSCVEINRSMYKRLKIIREAATND